MKTELERRGGYLITPEGEINALLYNKLIEEESQGNPARRRSVKAELDLRLKMYQQDHAVGDKFMYYQTARSMLKTDSLERMASNLGRSIGSLADELGITEEEFREGKFDYEKGEIKYITPQGAIYILHWVYQENGVFEYYGHL